MSFAGVRIDTKVLRGSLELSGTAATLVAQNPPAVTATALPVKIGYDALKDRLKQAIAAMPAVPEASVRDIEIYPSSGKLVIGLRVARPSDTEPDTGKWIYLTGAIQVDADGRAMHLSDLAIISDSAALAPLIEPITAQLGTKANVDYDVAYENLLNAANTKLKRPLKGGFRMDGHLSSAKLEKVYLPADGIVIALRANGSLKILYGM